jgi:hypothetical protein
VRMASREVNNAKLLIELKQARLALIEANAG